MWILVLIGLCFVLVIVCYFTAKQALKLMYEIRELKAELEKQKRNSAYLATHAAEMARIERSNNALKKELKGAKSDEEIADIINAVIDSNNKRVQNNTN